METVVTQHACFRLKSLFLVVLCLFPFMSGISRGQGTVIFLPISDAFSDNFTNRLLLDSPSPSPNATTNEYEGTLSNATLEVDEPVLDGISSGQTAWAAWQAPYDGIVTLSAAADTFSPLVTVYAGPDVPVPPLGSFPGSWQVTPLAFTNLSLVASNNYLICYDDNVCGCHWRERNQISFHVRRGQQYQICVDSAIITDASFQEVIQPGIGGHSFISYAPVFTTNAPVGGPFSLIMSFTPAPLNDDFGGRFQLSGAQVGTEISNLGATKEPGEPNHLGNPGGSSVWYTWTAPVSGRVTLTTNLVPVFGPPFVVVTPPGGVITIGTFPGHATCGNEVDQNPPPIFYPLFAAYTGEAVDALTPADNLPMQLTGYANGVEFDAIQGQTYSIAFDGNQGTTGTIPFYLALTPAATNDNFSSRIILHGISLFATGYNAGATHETGEPFFGGSNGRTVWWSWTAPVSGNVTLDLTYSDYKFPVAVFTGQKVNALQLVAEGSGGLSFTATRGQTYQIAVSDDQGLTGAIELRLQAPEVDLPRPYTMHQRGETILSYPAVPGEVVALLTSTDNIHWYYSQIIESTGALVTFRIENQTSPRPSYRAIIFDQLSAPPERRPSGPAHPLIPPVAATPLFPQPPLQPPSRL